MAKHVAGFWISPQLNIGSDGVLKISSEVTTGIMEKKVFLYKLI